MPVRCLGLAALTALALAALLACAAPDPRSPAASSPRLAAASALGAAPSGFARALVPPELAFPRDHGPHPEFRTEWWYFTGSLFDADGNAYGFQLTFFRQAMAPPAEVEASSSAWRTGQVFMAHLALSDERRQRFRFAERFARAAVDLAGARSEPFRVWLEDWRAAALGPEVFPLHLRAFEDDWGLDLELSAGKPLVLQGDRGLSRKGPEPGNASIYYSHTRLPARGRLRLAEREVEVSGTAWLDREWSTSALAPGVVGWDWFALQLDDGNDLMFYRLRRLNGGTDPWSKGAMVAPDGGSRGLVWDEVRLEERDLWQSPRTAVRYPVSWRLTVPGEGLDLAIEPRLRHQELDVTVRYWEGAVRVSGRRHGHAVRGHGFVELVGYGELSSPLQSD